MIALFIHIYNGLKIVSLLLYFLQKDYYSFYLNEKNIKILYDLFFIDKAIKQLIKGKDWQNIFTVKPIHVKKIIYRDNDKFFVQYRPSSYTETDVQNDFIGLWDSNIRLDSVEGVLLKQEQRVWLPCSNTCNVQFRIEATTIYGIHCKNSFIILANIFKEKLELPYYTVSHYHLLPYYQLIHFEFVNRYSNLFSIFEPSTSLFELTGFSKTRPCIGLIVNKQAALTFCHNLNKTMALLQFESNTPTMKSTYQKFIKDPKRNIQIVKTYVKQLIKSFKAVNAEALGVIELKLAIPELEGIFDDMASCGSFNEAVTYRKEVIKFLQNQSYFDEIKGMLWRLDYDVFTGHYFYVFHLFGYKESKTRNQLIVDSLTEHQKQISIKDSHRVTDIPYLSYQLLLSNPVDSKLFINRILAHYERDLYGHVNSQGKKKMTFGKKAIVPLTKGEMLKHNMKEAREKSIN